MARIKAGRRLFPFEDLKVADLAEIFLTLDLDQLYMGLGVLVAMGPTQPRLVASDENGQLLLGAAAAQSADAVAAATAGVSTANEVFNGATWDRLRSASAADMAAALGLGAILASPPGMWSVVSTPAAGAQATASKAAGAAGVRHVCTGIVVTWGAIAAPVATALQWNLRDGATGAGTILASGQLAVPAAVFQGQPVILTDIAIPGSPATAMTLEFSVALANLLEGVTLTGFDAS